MILSSTAVTRLKLEWAGVVKMRHQMKTLIFVAHAGGGLAGPPLRKVIFNLPLLLAFDVLREALRKAKREKLLVCERDTLGGLMECGKHSLPWIDWPTLREGVRRRNEVAHDGKLFEQTQCLQDIASVEAQLIEWKVIDAP